MKPNFKIVLIFFATLIGCSAKSQDTLYTSITTRQLSVYKIREIKDLTYFSSTCGCINDTNPRCDFQNDTVQCYFTWLFNENGVLTKGIFDDGTALSLSGPYKYLSYKNNKIYERNGNGLMGTAEVSYSEKYTYKNGKMDSAIGIAEGINEHGEGIIDYTDLTTYSYYKDGKLKAANTIKSSVVNGEGNRYMYYRNGLAIGFIDALANMAEPEGEKDFNAYLNHNMSSKEKRDILNFNYVPIKDKNLLFNGMSAGNFFHLQTLKRVNYLIIEIFDNHFLFYKISN